MIFLNIFGVNKKSLAIILPDDYSGSVPSCSLYINNLKAKYGEWAIKIINYYFSDIYQTQGGVWLRNLTKQTEKYITLFLTECYERDLDARL